MKHFTRSMRLSSVLLLVAGGCIASSDSPDVTLEKANILADRGKYEDAIAGYTKALESFSDRADVYYQRGVCYENERKFPKALDDYTKCLELDPEYGDAINNKGVVLAQLKRFQEAADQFTLLVDKYPDNVLALRNRGLCLHDLGKFDEAIRDYEKALQLNDADAQTWFQKGNVFLEQDKFEKAIADFDTALKLDDEYAKAWMNRGVAKFHMGNRAEAMTDLQKSSELDENIVIPGIDWADAPPEADVVMVAKPVFAENGGWLAAESFAKDFLVNEGFSSVTVIHSYSELNCALVSAEKDSKAYQVYVGLAQDGSVSLPAQTEMVEETTDALLVLKSSVEADGKPSPAVYEFDADWTLEANASPVVVEVLLKPKSAE